VNSHSVRFLNVATPVDTFVIALVSRPLQKTIVSSRGWVLLTITPIGRLIDLCKKKSGKLKFKKKRG
jgi:hypothetical protein